MRRRSAVIALSVLVCSAILWAVLAHGHQLSELRVEHQRLEAANPATDSAATEVADAPSTREVPRELLRLRAEVARLSQQQRDLASARPENERLRLDIENRRTNSAPAKAGNAGYMRMSELKWRGYNTPDDTLQSAFWAVQNRDLAKYLETIRPDVAKKIAEGLQNDSRSDDDFFKNMHLPPVFRIAGREQNEDGTILLQLEITRDIAPVTIWFRQLAGQWKLESPLR